MQNWIWNSGDNERLSIWNGSFATVSLSIGNSFIAMYVLDALHATNSEMGLLNSLQSLINLFAMFVASIAISRTRNKKLFCAVSTTVSRTFYVWIAMIPFLPFSGQAMIVVWLVALTRLPQSFGDLSWQALISDLIVPTRRSSFFGERNRVMTIVGLFVTLIAGLILQQYDRHDPLPYQFLFLSTVIFAFLEVALLLRHDESAGFMKSTLPVVSNGIKSMGLTVLRSVLRDRRFMIVVGALLFFNFAWQMAWPLFNIYQIRTAHASALWLALFSVANQAAQIATFRWWGTMADRHGNAKMIVAAAFGMAAAPILTIVSTNMVYLLVLNLFTGIPLAGTLLLTFNYLLDVCPDEQRTTYIAVYNVALSVVGFAGPEIGIWLLNQTSMSGGMITSTLLRFMAGFVFLVVAYRLPQRTQSRTNAHVV